MRQAVILLLAAGCAIEQSAATASTQPSKAAPRLDPVTVDLDEARFETRVPTPNGETHALELTRFTAKVDTSPGLVVTSVDVSVRNPTDQQLEANIRVPIPPGAAVTSAVLFVSDKPMVGAFVERQRARSIYDRIVSKKRDPLLAVWGGPNWIDVSIFPIEGQSERRFVLSWVEPRSVAEQTYRVPLLAHRGALVGRPTAIVLDGRGVPSGSELVLDETRAPAIAGRRPGSPLGYLLHRSPEQAPPLPRATVVLVETAADMSAQRRESQRAALDRLLEQLGADARVTLLAADWLVTPFGIGLSPSEARAQLADIDALPSAGFLDLPAALKEATAQADRTSAGSIVYLGAGSSPVGTGDLGDAVDRLRASDLSLSVVSDKPAAPLADVAWLSGGQVVPEGYNNLAELVPVSYPAPAISGVEQLYPLDTVAGGTVWIGRYTGVGPTGASRGSAPELEALWLRARAVRLPPSDTAARQPASVLTPLTSILVLESQADYQRWGLGAPDQRGTALDTARSAGVMGQLDGESGGAFGALTGAGGGGIGWGTIGHGSGTGSGYGYDFGGHLGLRGRTARVPRVDIGSARVQGSLDVNIIRRYVRRQLPRIRYCYEKELLTKPALAGRVDASFSIAASGQLTGVRITGPVAPSLRRCIARAIEGIQFPPPQGGGTVHVRYPFNLRPAGPASPEPSEPSPWERGLELLGKSGDGAPPVADIAQILGGPTGDDPALLAWWIVQDRLRITPQPGDATVLAALLLERANLHRDARRVLSEAVYAAPSRVQETFESWQETGDAARVQPLVTGR